MTFSLSTKLTLSSKLMACLGQEDMTDVHLLGTDGVKVPAFRTILACQSNVFRKMLFGAFEESTSSVVRLDYDSKVLKAVVEFCITDEVRSLEGEVEEAGARTIVQLVACADFLSMPLLQEKARALANVLLKYHKKSLACAIFDEASAFGEPTDSIKLVALGIIQKFPEETLLSNPAILSMKPDPLGALISDDGIACEEITLFRALNEWATAKNDSPEEADRMRIAKDIAADHIRLQSIDPTNLIEIVRKSCLVDKVKIYEALEAQALLAQKESGVQFSKKRKVLTPGFTVSGAGTDIVNGIYEEDGEHEGFPKYTKRSLWKGEMRTFCIYRYDEPLWYLAVVGKDGEIGAISNDFYQNCDQESMDQESVPVYGWQKSKLGSKPCPCVRSNTL